MPEDSSKQDPLGKDQKEEEKLKSGPFALLYDAVVRRQKLLIHCRNDRKLLGRLRMFDRHMNMILDGVEEIWTSPARSGKGKKRARAITKQRFIPKLLLRGDSVILAVLAPQTVAQPTTAEPAELAAAPSSDTAAEAAASEDVAMKE